MPNYLLCRRYPFSQVDLAQRIVKADDEQEARELAAHAMGIDEPFWLDENQVKCIELANKTLKEYIEEDALRD